MNEPFFPTPENWLLFFAKLTLTIGAFSFGGMVVAWFIADPVLGTEMTDPAFKNIVLVFSALMGLVSMCLCLKFHPLRNFTFLSFFTLAISVLGAVYLLNSLFDQGELGRQGSRTINIVGFNIICIAMGTLFLSTACTIALYFSTRVKRG